MARRFVHIVTYPTRMEAFTSLDKAVIDLLQNGYRKIGCEWTKTNSKAEILNIELK